MNLQKNILILFLAAAAISVTHAGPYSRGSSDAASAYDAPVPGFTGPNGDGKARIDDGNGGFMNPNNYVNPLFFGWADSCENYSPSSGVGPSWANPAVALGAVTGDNFDITSLGDLNSTQIASGTAAPGSITLKFLQPVRNRSGADLVIFENGFFSQGGAGQVLGELAYLEVSSDGTHFVRFPSQSLTPARVGSFGPIDPTNVFNLAGKHVNGYGECWGTPFDLSQVSADPLVTSGTVNLNDIRYARLVDIPGDGTFKDSSGRSIYDAWVTMGSGGFDLEAVGVVSRDMTFTAWQTQRGLAGAALGDASDPDGDGLPNLLEYAFAWLPNANESYNAPTTLAVAGNRLKLSFTRDERAVDLTYEVQASNDLQSWTSIARSVAGASVAGIGGFNPEIVETSASGINSIGVFRKVTYTDVQDIAASPRRFLRVKVTH